MGRGGAADAARRPRLFVSPGPSRPGRPAQPGVCGQPCQAGGCLGAPRGHLRLQCKLPAALVRAPLAALGAAGCGGRWAAGSYGCLFLAAHPPSPYCYRWCWETTAAGCVRWPSRPAAAGSSPAPATRCGSGTCRVLCPAASPPSLWIRATSWHWRHPATASTLLARTAAYGAWRWLGG